jgi:hypothetical protein
MIWAAGGRDDLAFLGGYSCDRCLADLDLQRLGGAAASDRKRLEANRRAAQATL